MSAPFAFGAIGVGFIVAAALFGRNRSLGTVLLGIGVGTGGYGLFLLFTDDPLAFLFDFVTRVLA